MRCGLSAASLFPEAPLFFSACTIGVRWVKGIYIGVLQVAFWDLLLAAPCDLIDYQDRMFHLGAGFWLVFGVRSGEPFVEEYEDEPGA